jgi:fumarylacetoacetase
MATADFSHHFSEKNIPYGIASSMIHKNPQAVTRLGNSVIFLHDLVDDLFRDIEGLTTGAFDQPTLNTFAALPKSVHQHVRQKLRSAYQKNGLDAFTSSSKEDVNAVTMHLPVEIKDFAGKYYPPCPKTSH